MYPVPELDEEQPRNRILVICHDLVGPKMAGPGIRYWELSHVLAHEFQVTLAAPGSTSLTSDKIEMLAYSPDDPGTQSPLEEFARRRADVVISSGHMVQVLPFLRTLAAPWVADVYIPVAVESLARHASSEPDSQAQAYRYSWNVTCSVARHADLLVCASERQRDFWLGVLAGNGRLRPEIYARDPGLRSLIDVVPFGCPKDPPGPAPAMKGVWPGIDPRDRLIVWAGGVWNWLDPTTLLQAMPQVLAQHPGAKLVFLGADHPDPALVPAMDSARRARTLSQDLGLEGRSVFWGDWVPYVDRGAYLLEADVGVSLHCAGVEARLAFRARLLDAIWAALPMVLTRGDVLAEEFERRDLGYVVDPGSVEQVAQAISQVLAEPNARTMRRAAFDELRSQLSWAHVSEPLQRFCRTPVKDEGKQGAIALADAEARKGQVALQAKIAGLEELVHRYESGRLMRTMAMVHRLRQRLLRE